MNLLEIFLIATGLAMDCFAVSFSAGATQKDLRFRNALLLGLFFGLFQGIMPLIGWIGGEMVVEKISHVDHWIAFCILAVVGGKMIFEATRSGKEKQQVDVTKWSTILILSVATSIDALAVGFSFSMINVSRIWLIITVVGLFSFIFSILGIYGGKKLCHFIKPLYAEIAGGCILIIIGSKILIEHLFL